MIERWRKGSSDTWSFARSSESFSEPGSSTSVTEQRMPPSSKPVRPDCIPRRTTESVKSEHCDAATTPWYRSSRVSSSRAAR